MRRPLPRNILLTLLSVVLTFLFGCNTHKPKYTPELRTQSMANFTDKEFTYESAILHTEKGILEVTADIESYLNEHTGIIWGFPGKDLAEVRAAFSSTFEFEKVEIFEDGSRIREGSLSYEFDPSIFEEGDANTTGQCVAISVDGYFMTASHVVEVEKALLFFTEHDIQNVTETPLLVPFRIVYENELLDFAIIKADVVTAFFLELHDQVSGFNEVVFAGSSLNGGPAAGKIVWNILQEDNEELVRMGARSIITNLPTTGGDSGSAVIDEEGRLLGVVAGGIKYKEYPRREFTKAVRVNPDAVKQIIEKDRAAFGNEG